MILDEINKIYLDARKNKDKILINLFSTLKSEIEVKAKNDKRSVIDEDCNIVIKKFMKNCDEIISVADKKSKIFSIAIFEKEILKTFLPVQLSEEELRNEIKYIIDNGSNNIGSIMKILKQKYDGFYNGKLASSIIKELLG